MSVEKNLEDLKNTSHWGWWLFVGIILMIIGLILITTPVITTLATVLVIGAFLIAAGIVHLITAFIDRKSHHLWLHLVIALFTLILGVLMILNPELTVVTLTFLLGLFFLASGVFRIIGSLLSRFRSWGWVLLNGIISFILGLLILFQWPAASLWVIGLFVGIDFLFAGWSLVMIAFFAKRKDLLVS